MVEWSKAPPTTQEMTKFPTRNSFTKGDLTEPVRKHHVFLETVLNENLFQMWVLHEVLFFIPVLPLVKDKR